MFYILLFLISAILLAGGQGERLKHSLPKAFVKIQDKEMFLHSLETFEQCAKISEVILVVPKRKIVQAKRLTTEHKKVVKVVAGGVSRMESLRNGLKYAKGDFILAHNAANPFVTRSEIERCVKTVRKHRAVGVGRRASSTMRTNSDTLDRTKIWLMETPQIVDRAVLERGLQLARKQKIEATDELQLAEIAGEKFKVVAASKGNCKITHASDLRVTPQSRPRSGHPPLSGRRIGLGVDSHRFSETKKALFLGGVRISVSGGLEANSDGDVLLHALTNAISSALGGGSLSTWSDAMCQRGIRDSRKYLEVVLKKMRAEDFEIANVSIALEGKKPKLEQHFPKIKKSLAKLLRLDEREIGLTATTGEELTSFGRGEGLQCFVIVLLSEL